MKKIVSLLPVLAVFFFCVVLSGCSGESSGRGYVKDGKEYGKVRGSFRHRWWNYYERGLSYADGAFFKEALGDLRVSVKMRDKDQRMARTYGMHFMDYFPHRELGVVHYQMGNLSEAKKELEISIGQFPSAKARFYLDKVRKGIFEKEKRAYNPPRIKTHFTQKIIRTKDDPVMVKGFAQDEFYVASVRIKGSAIFQEGAKKRIRFEKGLSLSRGRHEVDVTATNLMGRAATQKHIIIVDREGPLVTLEEIKKSVGGEVQIRGSVYDDSGIGSLSIQGRNIRVTPGVETLFSRKINIKSGEILLETEDKIGNRTRARFPVSGKRIAQNGFLFADLNTDRPFYALLGRVDTAEPVITLRDWTEKQTVYLSKIYLEGRVSDESMIESLSVDNDPALRRKGRSLFFARAVPLKKGENRITITARDEAGNRAEKTITVIRKIPKALQLSQRLKVSVLPFSQKGEGSRAGLSYMGALIDALSEERRFSLVERAKMELVLRELKLSATDLVERDTALKLGKMVAARNIITGDIINTSTGVEIVGRMIDAETSEIIATKDVYDEITDVLKLRPLARGMAVKFHLDFPLLGGEILKKEGKAFLTDLGKGKTAPNRRFIIYREEAVKHPTTGKVLGSDNRIIGSARVKEVLANTSRLEIISGKPDDVQSRDKVITE